jgi:hypothetical protein
MTATIKPRKNCDNLCMKCIFVKSVATIARSSLIVLPLAAVSAANGGSCGSGGSTWVLPWSGDGAAQYTVDITVDTIKFITP